jgi:hypothetical protein
LTWKISNVSDLRFGCGSARIAGCDKDVFLYYKQYDKLYCVVVRHAGPEGFLITAYPADKVKEGDVIWTK